MSLFSEIPLAPPIEVFYKNKLYAEDPSSNKVNLTIGAYRGNDGKPWVLPVVREVEKMLASDPTLNHEYLTVTGHDGFREAATALILGDDSPAIKEGRAFGVQCLSGTGSLRAGAEFLARVVKLDTVYISQPTWTNHKMVFENSGFTAVREYAYWDDINRCVAFDKLIESLETAPERAVIVLHGCAHNPTGMDPTKDQWKKIAELIKRKNLFPFFDIAYQGFASGDPDADAWAVRYFVAQGLEALVAQSFAKNFGLYNERAGNLAVVVSDKRVVSSFISQISLVLRANWSNPPAHGALVVHRILTDPKLRQGWLDSLKGMADRIKVMRTELRSRLEKLRTPGIWSHITDQIGMFSFTGLNPMQVEFLMKRHRIYMISDGRISVCGLNTSNIDHVAMAIDDAVRNCKLISSI